MRDALPQTANPNSPLSDPLPKAKACILARIFSEGCLIAQSFEENENRAVLGWFVFCNLQKNRMESQAVCHGAYLTRYCSLRLHCLHILPNAEENILWAIREKDHTFFNFVRLVFFTHALQTHYINLSAQIKQLTQGCTLIQTLSPDLLQTIYLTFFFTTNVHASTSLSRNCTIFSYEETMNIYLFFDEHLFFSVTDRDEPLEE